MKRGSFAFSIILAAGLILSCNTNSDTHNSDSGADTDSNRLSTPSVTIGQDTSMSPGDTSAQTNSENNKGTQSH